MKFRILIDSLLVGEDSKKHFQDAIYYEPEDLAEDNYAKIFLHIETKDNFKSSKIVASAIFDTIKEYLYTDLKKDPYEAFESSLKEVNKAVMRVKLDYTDWVGKLNATIGIFSGDMVHVSVTGDSDVLLVRNGKISVISEGLKPDEGSYNTIFENIASGSLKEDDFLILSQTSILKHVTEDQIINSAAKKQLANSALSLEKAMEFHYLSALLILIQPAFKDAEKASLDDIDIDDTEMEDDGNKSNIFPKKETIAQIKKNLVKGKNFIKKLREIFVPPMDGDLLEQEVKSQDLDSDNPWDDERELRPGERMKQIAGMERTETLDDIKNALNQGIARQKAGTVEKSKFDNTFDLLKKNVGNSLQGLNFKQPKFSSAKRSHLVAIGIIVILALLAISSVYSKYKTNQETEIIRGQLTEIDNLIERAKGRNIIDEKDKAREILVEIDAKMQTLLTANYLQNEIKDKEKEINTLRDSVNEIQSVDIPKEYANLESKYPGVSAIDLIFLKDTLYAVSKDALLKLVFDEVVLIPLTLLGPNEDITEATVFESESSILLFTNQKRVFEYKREEFKEVKLADANIKWENASAMETFGRRVYFLDPTKDQIWKYTKQGDTFLAPTEYKPYDVDIKISLDMTIASDIFVLNRGGFVYKTSSRESQEFKFQNMPQDIDLSGITRLEYLPVMKQLFLLDSKNSKVIVTGGSGQYVKQYLFPNIGEIKHLYVNENTKNMFVLTSSKVFELDLN